MDKEWLGGNLVAVPGPGNNGGWVVGGWKEELWQTEEEKEEWWERGQGKVKEIIKK